MNDHDLRARLADELGSLPTTPTASYDHVVAAADRRRGTRRALATSVGTVGVAAAVAVGLLLDHATTGAHPAPRLHTLQQLSPGPSASPTLAVPGDVDGDGTPDTVTLTGGTASSVAGYLDHPTVTLVGSRVGSVSLVLAENAVKETRPAIVDLAGDGGSEIAVEVLSADAVDTQVLQLVHGRLVLVHEGDGSVLDLIQGGGVSYSAGWTCSDAAGTFDRPGSIAIGELQPQPGSTTARQLVRRHVRLVAGVALRTDSATTTGVDPETALKPYDGCGILPVR